jgi:DNA replication and repair protein RecF
MIASLHLEGFRNIASQKIQFIDGINLFYGANGAGKTNILEALGLFSLSKSCRGAKDAELVGFGRETAEINAEIADLKKKPR